MSGLTYGYTDGIKLTSIADGVTAANNVTLTYSLDLLAKAIADTSITGKPSQQLIADELAKLFELLQKGAITQQEYLQQKNRLLA